MNTTKIVPPAQVSQFTDPRASQASLAGTMCAHQLQVSQHYGQAANTSHVYAPLSALAINYLNYGVDVEVSAEMQKSCYLIILPREGKLECHSNDRRFTATPERAVIISPGQRWRVQVPNGTTQCVLRIGCHAVERQVIRLLGHPMSTPVQFNPVMPTGEGVFASWWRTLQYLERELRKPDSIYRYQHAVEQVEHLLLSTLLQLQLNTLSEETCTEIAPDHVLRTEVFIRDNAQQPIDLDQIIAASGVPKRTLYNGFKRFRNITPMGYLREVRMKGARKDLISGTIDSVTTTALAWGFNHLGRFSVEYKKLFGESPSETFLKARC